MKVIVTIGGLDPKYGGPSQSVPGLCRALASSGSAIAVISFSEEIEVPIEHQERDGYQLSLIRTGSRRFASLNWIESFRAAITAASSGTHKPLIYDIGVWLPSNHVATEFAYRHRIPLVISPRGMLSQTALGVSRWKKRIAWMLYQRRDLSRACGYHATSENELRDIRARNLTSPVAVIPNGVELPTNENGTRKVGRSEARASRRTLLFLSRIHPIKGVKDLVLAWANVRPRGWRAIVAGPDECHHTAEVQHLVDSLGLHNEFSFPGPISVGAKWQLYRDSDLFVLPSYSESFGQVVVEALGSGVPVITTKATPWREVEDYGCGWWIDTGAAALSKALTESTALGSVELHAMGARGKKLVSTKYNWPSVAAQMIAFFQSVSDSGNAARGGQKIGRSLPTRNQRGFR